ncbi:MAG: MotA/TolQ/ExbB proton channel family protein [Elusimicrobia bacterium]|nr:MotA/TolQ/ExbB proton channel family protein [Elusimicrobiota bacterium]
MVMLAFVLERWLYYRKVRSNGAKFIEGLLRLLEEGRFDEALELCERCPGPVAAVAHAVIKNKGKLRRHIEELAHAVRMEQRLALERYLGILGTLGNTAPFIGLFGTVVGIIKAFHDLALSGAAGPSVVAAGISEALVATAGGLAVAIPAVMTYNYFLKVVKDVAVTMEMTQIRALVYIEGSDRSPSL